MKSKIYMNKVLTIYKGGRDTTTHELVLYTDCIHDMVVYQFEGGSADVILIVSVLEASGVIKVTSDEWATRDDLLDMYLKIKSISVDVGINPIDILLDYRVRIEGNNKNINAFYWKCDLIYGRTLYSIILFNNIDDNDHKIIRYLVDCDYYALLEDLKQMEVTILPKPRKFSDIFGIDLCEKFSYNFSIGVKIDVQEDILAKEILKDFKGRAMVTYGYTYW